MKVGEDASGERGDGPVPVRTRLVLLVLLVMAVLSACTDPPDDRIRILRYHGKGQSWEASIIQAVPEGWYGGDDPRVRWELVVRYIGPDPAPTGPIRFGYQARLSSAHSSGNTLDRNREARLFGRFQLLPDETVQVTVEWGGQAERIEAVPTREQ